MTSSVSTYHTESSKLNLLPKILRNRVFNSIYWKEHCFALSAATLIDKAF